MSLVVHYSTINICTFSGDHSVEVKLAGVHVEGSPFLVKAYDAAKVKVTDINSGVVGKPVFFSSMYKIYIYIYTEIYRRYSFGCTSKLLNYASHFVESF